MSYGAYTQVRPRAASDAPCLVFSDTRSAASHTAPGAGRGGVRRASGNTHGRIASCFSESVPYWCVPREGSFEGGTDDSKRRLQPWCRRRNVSGR